MKKLLMLFVCLSFPFWAKADNVILMIGDGMGANHLKCAADTKPIYIPSLPVKGWIHTRSANRDITDSAASATAYSCGKRTNNYMLGKLPDGSDCLTIAEEAAQKGLAVGIYSTDHPTGATPSAFYAHTYDRNDKKTIELHKAQAQGKMDIAVPVLKVSEQIEPRLDRLKRNPKGFFAMFEGSGIDTNSHSHNLKKMKEELYDFDLGVMNAADFVYRHPNTTLIVLADHETGGLSDKCVYTAANHTGVDIPVHAYGQHAKLFEGVQDNTEIYRKIHQILFPSQQGNI
ncbi:MAG: alkaline phosphatase [Alphaproteobacteria bacterium]|nr:alkaline phosphatase [Alphaproteobacteria bacterium]